MNISTVVVLLVIFAAFILAVIKSIRGVKNHTCGCGCENCSGCAKIKS